MPVNYVLRAFWVFCFASAMALGLVLVRYWFVKHFRFYFLLWNLFLAWIPFVLAVLTVGVADLKSRIRWFAIPLGLIWLVFLPNAPYLCTDVAHLIRGRPLSTTLMWFDLLLNLHFALTGLLLGLVSLSILQHLWDRKWGKFTGWIFAFGALGLAGLGIYVGRFLRFNTWDLFHAPLRILRSIARRAWAPVQHQDTWEFTFLCFLFLSISYLMCYHLMRWNKVSDLSPSIPHRP